MMKERLQVLLAICLAMHPVLSLAQSGQAKHDKNLGDEAKRYLTSHEQQLKSATDPGERWNLLYYLAPAALHAGDKEKAMDFAGELITLGERLKTQPGFGPSIHGQATHIGNLVLGQLAFDKGEINKAKEHLLAAARVDGSPVLKSFGPDMMLAKDLLEKGEREVVVKYFDLCAAFWEKDNGLLADWKGVVQQNGMPDFGPHLQKGMSAWRNAH